MVHAVHLMIVVQDLSPNIISVKLENNVEQVVFITKVIRFSSSFVLLFFKNKSDFNWIDRLSS